LTREGIQLVQQGFTVDRDSLLAQAKVWEQQADTMGTISGDIAQMTITGIDAGIFADAVSAYNNVAAQVGEWCGQGHDVMLAITYALCRSALQYGATEQEIMQITHGIPVN
jgi:hypothetical protein